MRLFRGNRNGKPCLLENELIRKLRPPYNEDGTYDFLYPAIGLGGTEKQVLLCFSTYVDVWENLDLRWYGVFKSRMRALAAFDALVYLLGLIGHIEPVRHLPPHERIRGSRLTGFRQLSSDIVLRWSASCPAPVPTRSYP